MRTINDKLYHGIAKNIKKCEDVDLLNAKVKTYIAILHRYNTREYGKDLKDFTTKQTQRYTNLLQIAMNRLKELKHE